MKKLKLTTIASGADFYQRILGSLHDYSVFTTDKKGLITSWNSGAEEIFGYKETEVKGKNYSLIFTANDQENKIPEKELRTAFTKGKTSNDAYYIRKDSSIFWASGQFLRLGDKEHEGGALQPLFVT